MDKWFEFGGVRGLIGFAVGLIQVALLRCVEVPALGPGVQSIIFGMNNGNYVNASAMTSFVQPTQPLSVFGILLALPVVFVVSGFMYWLGAKILEKTEVKVGGVWKAIASGLTGGLVLGVILILLVCCLSSLMPVFGGVLMPVLFFAMLASMPVLAIAEIGYAVVTWWIYKQSGWELPE